MTFLYMEMSSLYLYEVRGSEIWEQSCLSLRQWIVLLYWWAREYPEAKVDEKTAYQRDICRECLCRLMNPCFSTIN